MIYFQQQNIKINIDTSIDIDIDIDISTAKKYTDDIIYIDIMDID